MSDELDEQKALKMVEAIDWDLLFENAACAAQHAPLCDDAVVKQAIMDNIVSPVLQIVAHIVETTSVDKTGEGSEGGGT